MELGYTITCPWCGAEHDGLLTAISLPVDGDIDVCFNCARVSIFSLEFSTITLRKPTVEEQRQLERVSVVQRVRELVLMSRAWLN